MSSYDRDNYVCSKCGNKDCKLWRPYNTAVFPINLFCVICAQKDQDKVLDLKKSDQIGWLVPAVPHEDTYWGYTSVPQDGVEWWQRLTTYPYRLATEQESEEIVERARTWGESAGGYFMFESAKSACLVAVAEFLANQRGLTLYEAKPSFLRRKDDEAIALRKKRLRERGIRT
jgi:hypothetical protein